MEEDMSFSGIKRTEISSFVLAGLAIAGLSGLYASPAFSQSRVIRIGGGGAYLGIQMEDVTAASMAKYKLSKEMGVIVASVEKGSPAEAAGLQTDDVILDYCGIPVISMAQLQNLVQETPPGRKATLAVRRDGKTLTLTPTLRERPGSSRDIGLRAFGGPNFDFAIPEGRGFWFERPGEAPRFNFTIPSESGPRLGVTLEPLTNQMAEFLGVPGKAGALVTDVSKGSSAEGHLRAGDVIVRADGKSIRRPDDLMNILRDKEGGATVDLVVVRDKKETTVTVTLGSGARRGFKL
jgi:serine protease Do